ncbi:MAG: glycosyltransferase family 4 protein [Roseiflexaceae bacterium]|nr:glycosyltransferase family 4 protein [Roseiflexaceae bacterium]
MSTRSYAASLATQPLAASGGVRTIAAIRSCDCGLQGPENLILALAEAFRDQGVRYVIINLWDGDPPTVALHQEATKRGLESHIVATASSFDVAILPKLAVLLQRLRPDVIHTHDFKSEMTALATSPAVRRPLVTSFYGRLAISSLFLKAEDWIRLVAFWRFRHLLANSQAQYDELRRWQHPARKITLLPSFVDTRQLRPASAAQVQAAREKLGLGLDQPVLATVARLSQNKGHSFMLEALVEVRKHVANIVYLIPGEGDSSWHGEGGFRGELERQAAALGVAEHVRFLGYYGDLQTILHATDLLVSPSLREGMQVSLIEAMAAGLPIVASAVGGTPDAVGEGVNGLLVPPSDAPALARAVLTLLGNRELMRQMGVAGRRRAEERFDSHMLAATMLGVCAEIVARG